MTSAAPDAPDLAQPSPHYVAREVARLTRLALPTIYELARRDPERFGVVRYGRAVRFQRARVDALVRGDA
jgi:predicted DNA-binding transcriptional regulator AlpA